MAKFGCSFVQSCSSFCSRAIADNIRVVIGGSGGVLVVVVAVVYPRAILQGREPDQEEDVKLIGKRARRKWLQ